MLNITTYAVQLELIEDLLGTVPKNKEVYAAYIGAKGRELIARDAKKGVPLASGEYATGPGLPEPPPGAPTVDIDKALGEETESIKEVEEKGWTGFHTDEEGPFLLDYVIRGFLSEAGRTLKEINSVKQLQDKVKRYVFIDRRKVRLPVPDKTKDWTLEGKPMLVVAPNGEPVCERPLRAMTPQGPRVTVVRSDIVAAGAVIEFGLRVLKGGSITKPILSDILSYGEMIGLGQWRSGGWGRFKVLQLEKTSGEEEKAD